MTPSDPVRACLDDLRRRLRSDPVMASRVLREVADHLDDGVAEEIRRGTPGDEARRRVVERFGEPAAFVASLGDHATLRLVGLIAGAGTILMGLLLLLALVTVVPPEDASIVSLAASGVLTYGVLTWVHLTRLAQPVIRAMLMVVSIGALAVGSFLTAQSIYVAYVTTDWEAYVSVVGVALALQGSVLLAYFQRTRLASARASTH